MAAPQIIYVKAKNAAGKQFTVKHGLFIDGEFRRYVRDKDLMNKMDAWTIHPDALAQILPLGCAQLHYIHTKKDGKEDHYFISIDVVNEKGFRRDHFAGGPTMYLPRQYWLLNPDTYDPTPKSGEAPF